MLHSPTPPNTPEQDLILEGWSGTKKSLMINALAGTGKTSTLKLLGEKMEELPRKYETLVLVFNKKNQEEMKPKLPSRFDVLTLNGLGYRALARGMNRKLTVDGQKDSTILKKVLEERNIRKLPDGIWQDVMALVAAAKSAGLVPEEWCRSDRLKSVLPDEFESWEGLGEEKMIDLSPEHLDLARTVLSNSIYKAETEGVIDFDDMIYLSVLGWGAYRRYPVVMVDEAQDLSPLNHLQLRKSIDFNGRFVVVGDPRQAIYAFRGAHTRSMGEIKALKKEEDWLDLNLSVTFRCPRKVVERQRSHVPLYEAFHLNPEGVIKNFREEWSVSDLPEGKVAILCRNNAPLLSCAFRLISSGYGVTMLGRDIGKNLVRLLEKICSKGNKPLSNALEDIQHWEDEEIKKAIELGKENRLDTIRDRSGCLLAIAEFSKVKDLETMKEALIDLFENQAGRFILGTGHRAKGMEWPTVVHLDPWRIPSKRARDAEEVGNPGPMEQEKNLRYVLETRAQQTLVLASLKDFLP